MTREKQKQIDNPSLWDWLNKPIVALGFSIVGFAINHTETPYTHFFAWCAYNIGGCIFLWSIVIRVLGSDQFRRYVKTWPKLRAISVGLVLFFLFLGTYIFASYTLWTYLKPQLVSISPSEFLLGGNGWNNTTALSITNNSDKVLYGVSIEIWTDNDNVKLSKLNIDFDENPNAIRQRLGEVEFSFDVMGFGGTYNSEPRAGKEFVQFIFYEILPHQTRNIIIRATENIPSKGFATIRGYQDKPNVVGSKTR